MAIVYETYRHFKNFPKIEPELFINIPIQAGIGKRTYEPYIPDLFKKLEQEILHGPKRKESTLQNNPELDVMECWESIRYRRGSPVWEKDYRGVWIQSERPLRSDVIWSRNFDGGSYTFKNIDADGDEYIESCGHFVERAHVHERNNTIFKTRCKYLRDYKTGRGNYENLGNYEYKNKEAKPQFLQEVEQKGVAKKAEPKKSTLEIKALDPTSQKDIVEPNNYFYDEETGDYEILREDEL